MKKTCAVLVLFLLIASFLSMMTGVFSLSLVELFKGGLKNLGADGGLILFEIRLPRTLLAILVGASLGLSGAAMQGLLRNPLAEPGILGVTGGGVLGAVLMMYTGVYAKFPLALPIGGMAGALLSVLLLYFCAGFQMSVQTLILAGIALNTLAFALTSLFLNLAPSSWAALEIVFWQMGSLADRSFVHVGIAAPFILLGWILLFWDIKSLNALSLGEETAKSMGVSLRMLRFRIILGTALCVGASVSICGSIAFVGLVVPHLLRPFVNYEPGKVLPVSALGGAVLLLLADIAVRTIPAHVELKLGVLTALIGAPFFIAIIFKMRKRSL